MVFNIASTLLEAIVLAVVGKEEEGTYGYKITQEIREAIEISESTLYPVLRRLQKESYLETRDKECGGRNRRYYFITQKGQEQLNMYQEEWEIYSRNIRHILME